MSFKELRITGLEIQVISYTKHRVVIVAFGWLGLEWVYNNQLPQRKFIVRRSSPED